MPINCTMTDSMWCACDKHVMHMYVCMYVCMFVCTFQWQTGGGWPAVRGQKFQGSPKISWDRRDEVEWTYSSACERKCPHELTMLLIYTVEYSHKHTHAHLYVYTTHTHVCIHTHPVKYLHNVSTYSTYSHTPLWWDARHCILTHTLCLLSNRPSQFVASLIAATPAQWCSDEGVTCRQGVWDQHLTSEVWVYAGMWQACDRHVCTLTHIHVSTWDSHTQTLVCTKMYPLCPANSLW